MWEEFPCTPLLQPQEGNIGRETIIVSCSRLPWLLNGSLWTPFPSCHLCEGSRQGKKETQERVFGFSFLFFSFLFFSFSFLFFSFSFLFLFFFFHDNNFCCHPFAMEGKEKELQRGLQHSEGAKIQFLGCKHYKRNCVKKCETCLQFFPCRFCHDEQVSDHPFDRFFSL